MIAETRPQLRIELMRRETHGNFSDRTIVVDDRLIFRRSKSGIILVDRKLKPEEVEEVQELIDKLDQIKLRRSYGRDHGGSWPITIVDINRVGPKFRKRIQVESNPYNPPPSPIIDLIRHLRILV